MKRFPILLAAMTTVSGIATELHVFSAGQAAKAQDVNDNFQRLDTAIQNRATKASLESTDGALKSVMSTVGTLQTGKAEKSDLDALSAKQKIDVATQAKATVDSAVNLRKAIPAAVDISGKANTSWVRDTLKVKADTSRVNGIAADVATLKASKVSLPTDKSGYVRGEAGVANVVAKIPASDVSGLTPSSIGAQTAGTYWNHDTAAMSTWNPLPNRKKVGGIYTGTIDGDWGGMFLYANSAGAGNTQMDVVIDGDFYAQEGKYQLYHSGNLRPCVDAGNRGMGAFTDLNPPTGSWYADPGGQRTPDAPNSSYNIQVFSTGNSGRGLQIAGAYDGDDYAIRRGQDGWRPWVQLVHSGNITQFALAPTGGTITGDLRITGKLTTPPGATPADYVFEPDYQLMSLSEVEAFTKVNKHLPEVPSAKEMTENGVDMAAMNMVLLKKVEELTLHAIALQKDVEAQKALLVQQKAQFEERLQRLESTPR